MKTVKREEEINILLEVIENREDYKENSENGLVILLNGEWGSGKTTFLRDLEKRIEDDGNYQVLCNYNSFEYDFYNNAYIPLFATLSTEVNGIEESSRKIIEITSNKMLKEGLPIIYKFIKEVVKTTTKLDLDSVKKAIENIKGDLDSEFDYLKEFKEFKKNKDNIKEKVALKCSKKPTIFIIDELDRCNPKFAIGTLEIVKHFFDIENCIFIISIDKNQLKESIKTVFGQNMDTDIYFSKFFDYQFNLDKIPFYSIVDEDKLDYYAEIILETSKLFDTLNISLRDSKKIFGEFINKYSNWNLSQSLCMMLMFTLKYTDLSMYYSIINGEYNSVKQKIASKENSEYYKYTNLLNLKLRSEFIYREFLEEFTKYRTIIFIDQKYSTLTMSSQLKEQIEILKIMIKYIPQVIPGITYLETIKKIIK